MRMKSFLFSIMLLALAASMQAQQKYYVTPTGTGNGHSWATAGAFQTIINSAAAGDSIFVSKGAYFPAINGSFSMKEGVKIYGGFAGTESSISQRKLGTSDSSVLRGNGNRVIDNTSNNLTSVAVLDGFTIRDGITGSENGGGMYNKQSSPTLTNLFFVNNYANSGGMGGGMSNENSSSPIVTNVSFVGNASSLGGSGMFNDYTSSLTLTNVTFVNNRVTGPGDAGGLYDEPGTPSTLTNCLFWGNNLNGSSDDINIDATLNINYSYTQTNQTARGTGNITGTTDPFVDINNPAGADGIYGTADDGIHLNYMANYFAVGNSPIEAGSNASIPSGINTDIAGSARIQNSIVDMGAYEGKWHLEKWFVKPNGTGNGSSWTNAGDFQTMINGSSAGDSLFVSKGSYQPASGQSFFMKEGVKIYGGFAGTENSLSQRNLAAGDSSVLRGNGNRVIDNTSNQLTTAALLDGFTITGGNGNDYGGGMYNKSSSPTLTNLIFINNITQGLGGGIYNKDYSSPKLTNVSFIGNSTSSIFGGGMHNYNFSSPTLINVNFVGNSSQGNGGGIYNSENASPVLTNVTFSANSAKYMGGGFYSLNSQGILSNCVFWENTAPTAGADIYQDGMITTIYSFTQTAQSGIGNKTGSTNPFQDSNNPAGADGIYGTPDDGLHLVSGSAAADAGNISSIPAGITTDIAGAARIQNSIVDMGAYEGKMYGLKWFVQPGAIGDGSSWATAGDFQTIINGSSVGDSVFVSKGSYQPASGQSFSMKEGVKIYGGFAGTENSLSLRSLANGDSSVLRGNGNRVINNSNLTAAAILDGFTIRDGQLTGYGGGMYNGNSSPTLTNVIFVNNISLGAGPMSRGGGMFNSFSSPSLTNVSFVNNSSAFGGGGMWNENSSPKLTNVTFASNRAPNGSAILDHELSSPTLNNCIFWGNNGDISRPDINHQNGSITVNYTYTQTNQTSRGIGNITGSSDPFADISNPAGADGIYGTADDGLKLKIGSTAIDAGDPLTNTNSYSVQAANTDIAGKIRIFNDRIDMGAYEYNNTALPVTLIAFIGILQNGIVNLTWHTGEEANFDHFEVEKTIGIVPGMWQSQSQGTVTAQGINSKYVYSLPQSEPKAYYRLKVVDNDGRSKYSNIVMLSQSDNVSAPVLYPNPAKNHIFVKISNAGTINIYDVNGRLVVTAELQAGNNRIDISNLQAGVFYGMVNGYKLKFLKE